MKFEFVSDEQSRPFQEAVELLDGGSLVPRSAKYGNRSDKIHSSLWFNNLELCRMVGNRIRASVDFCVYKSNGAFYSCLW